MARATGHGAQLLLAFETTYGEAPATGAYFKLPFISLDVGGEQGLLEDDILGLGRDPQAPTYDLFRDGGQIIVPLDVRNIGYWLKLVLGAPTTTGTGPYTHVFVSGKTVANLVSASIEVGNPEVPAYFLNKGVRGNSIQFQVTRTGKLQAVVEVIGQDEAKSTSAVDATPNENAVARFDAFEGHIERNDSDLANVLNGNLTYSNNMEPVETTRADALVEDVDPGMASLRGTLNTRFASTTLYDDAKGQSGIDVDFEYEIDASNKLTVSAHEVYLPVAKRPISGPGGVEASFDLQGAYNATAGEMMEVTLINDMANYDNAA